MEHPVTGIDHAFLLVQDLERARDAYARLGFTVSPRGLHSPHKGSANHTIMFPRDYLELLGLIAETDGNADRRETLACAGEGLHAVACRIEDAVRAEAALREHGIATGERSDFARPVDLPDGRTGEAAFSTLAFDPADVPVATAFMCQHRTRDTVWQPELLEHPNGAHALAGLVAGVDNPQDAARRFALLFAAGAATEIDGGWRVATGTASAALTLLERPALAARYGAFDLGATPARAFAVVQIAAPDQARLRDVLEANGITTVKTGTGLAVGPEIACGAILEFFG